MIKIRALALNHGLANSNSYPFLERAIDNYTVILRQGHLVTNFRKSSAMLKLNFINTLMLGHRMLANGNKERSDN